MNIILRNDLKIAGVENIWVDTQDLLIGVIYNPPSGSQRDFIDEFENVLHSVFLSRYFQHQYTRQEHNSKRIPQLDPLRRVLIL